jgi:hypothetical protein
MSGGSRLSGICFRGVVRQETAPAYNPVSLQHHGRPRTLFSPFVNPTSNSSALRLEDWIVDPGSKHLPVEGGQVVAYTLPSDTGCVYSFLIDIFNLIFGKGEENQYFWQNILLNHVNQTFHIDETI